MGACIIHMLRDTADDLAAGYFNVPRSMLESQRITPSDLHHPAYRRWVRERVDEARWCFADGKRYLRRVGCLRALIAGLLYCARFEVVLRQIELDGYRLRSEYDRLQLHRLWLDRFVRGHRSAPPALRVDPACPGAPPFTIPVDAPAEAAGYGAYAGRGSVRLLALTLAAGAGRYARASGHEKELAFAVLPLRSASGTLGRDAATGGAPSPAAAQACGDTAARRA